MERIACVLSPWRVFLLPTDWLWLSADRMGAPGRRRGPGHSRGRRLSSLAQAGDDRELIWKTGLPLRCAPGTCPTWSGFHRLQNKCPIPSEATPARKRRVRWVGSAQAALSPTCPPPATTHSLLLSPGVPSRTHSRSNPSSLLGTPSGLKRSVFLGK